MSEVIVLLKNLEGMEFERLSYKREEKIRDLKQLKQLIEEDLESEPEWLKDYYDIRKTILLIDQALKGKFNLIVIAKSDQNI